MTRTKDEGICEHCRKTFGYYLIHNGFNESSYAYCDQCGMPVLLHTEKIPKGVNVEPHQVITQDVERHLLPCSCGGSFRSGAGPRCPHCHDRLSPVSATEYIEAHAEGTKAGWRWQKTWAGLYCIIIEDRFVQDVWRRNI